jgi:hypothetical protein
MEALKAAAADQEKAAAALAEYEKLVPEKQAAWEASLGTPVVWEPVELVELKSEAGATLTKQDDQSVLVTGKLAKDTYMITATTKLAAVTGLKLEALTDDSLPAKGPGRAKNGNFVVSELKLSIGPKSEPSQAEAVALENAFADFAQANYPAAGAIDGNDQTGWAVSPQFGKPHEAVFQLVEAAQAGDKLLKIALLQQFNDGKHALGKFRLSVTGGDKPLARTKLPEAVAAALAVPKSERTSDQQRAIAEHYRSLDSELSRLSEAAKTAAEQAKNARALGVQDLAWALINNPAFLFNR